MALRRVSDGEQLSIKDLAQRKWRNSGITDRQAKRLRLEGLPAAKVAALGPNYHAAGALRIPYFDLAGKPTKFFRVRYLEPLPGFAGQVEDPQRFAQDIRTLNEIYLPPLLRASWKEIADDEEVQIFITEGELKAAAGCAAGLATLGLGGVDVWRASKRGIAFLPVLTKFKWKNREVLIVYDSDLATKPGVIRAQRNLAQELLSRGARVEIISIPAAADGKKQGLDDYLVALGGDALLELVEGATAFPESDALWEMNEEVLVVRDPGFVAERRSGRLMNAHLFHQVVYANRHYMETQVKSEGKKTERKILVRKPLAKHWLEWEHRAEVERTSYEPGKPKEWEGTWNLWPGWGVEPKRGDVGPWHWLMDYLFKKDVKIRKWFEHWAAYPLQHPGAKLYTAVLIWSNVKRVGKSLAFYSLGKIYGENFIEINNKSIKGDFNFWAKHRQFIHANEIKGIEAKIDADWLKNIITSPTVTINEKNVPQYTRPNRMNHGFESNHPDALFLEDGDQRYMVHEVLGGVADRAKYEIFDKWLHGDGPSHLFRYLLDMNLGGFSPREHAPDTEGKRAMIMLGKTDASGWVHLLKEDPVQALKIYHHANTCDLFTPTQLWRAFDPNERSRSGVVGLGRSLAAAGFRQLNHGIPMLTSLGLQRLYAVREADKWEKATRKEIVEHFDKYWAPDSPERRGP